jgi:hypothetical protein
MQLAQTTGLHELVGPSVRIGFVRLERSKLIHGLRPYAAPEPGTRR